MTTNTLLDEECMTIYSSPSGKRHVGAWYGMVLCGAFVDHNLGWERVDLTSVRWLAKIAQGVGHGHQLYCKRCINNYKDVIVDA